MAMSQQEKIAKQNACPRCISLFTHNLKGKVRPPKGRECNFAHVLSELQVPEEMYGDWPKTWETAMLTSVSQRTINLTLIL